MADSMKPKLFLRSGASFSTADRTTSPGAKLMLNHGKPNFTIQRSANNKQVNGSKADNGSNSNNSTNNNNNNNNNLNAINFNNQKGKHYNDVLKPTTNIKSQWSPKTPTPTEGSKFILRRTKTPNSLTKSEDEEDSEPEFIKAQRRIQERLAKDNILDFDKRKSGYFTQVMMSPTSPNSKRTFGETMESPEPMPTMEFNSERSSQKLAPQQLQNGIEQSNGDEKVNDDSFISLPSLTNGQEKFEEKTILPNEKISVQNGHLDSIDEKSHIEEHPEEKQNGHQKDKDDSLDEVPVTQTNGYSIPAIPSPDPSGIKGVNFEPTTVVSFAQELSNEPNKYPDTVKIVTDVKTSDSSPSPPPIDEELRELAKLKFDIETDQEDVKVTPVLRTDE